MICKICNIEKDNSFFEKRKDTGYYRKECKKCRNIREKNFRNGIIKHNPIINLENERWTDVFNFNGLYQISDFGRIKSMQRFIVCKNGKLRKIKEIILKQSGKIGEYKSVTLVRDNINYYYSVHRLVAIHYIENPELKPQVNHIDGDKSNNYYLNLEWSTMQENCDHKLNVLKVKFPTGALNKHSFSILIIDQNGNEVIKKGIKEIARTYKIDVSGIMRVLKNKQSFYKGFKFKYL